ncbi:MAG: Hsp70 family protein, partial [Pseudonocardiaceae bacterium]
RMSYWLGIDVGTTFTAAAICRLEGGRSGVPEVVALGTRSTAVSSVLYLAPDGQVVVGEAAERRAVTDPDRVVREFKRRIGDEVPMVIGGRPHSAPEITAMVLGWVIERVAAREGGPATGIVVTHPAGWGPYKISTMTAALRAAGLASITFRTEPEAAAASYALAQRIDSGSTIAVYDLGGGTFDAAVVRKTGATTLQVLGVPQGLDALGGADFDDAIMRHVITAVPALAQLDPDDPATLAATAALRRECTNAKEALSSDTEVTIPVLAPGVQSQVRLIRAEFEDMIRPHIEHTIEALRRALRSADLEPHDLDAVLLVGGSSRIPLVAQLVSAELGRPVAIDTDPKAAIALGAALSALPTDISSVLSADVSVDGDLEYQAVDGGAVIETSALAAGSELPASTPAEVPQRPSLTALPLDVEPAALQWRRTRSRRVKHVVLAGTLALFTVAGVASVPFLTSRTGPIPPANAGTSTPRTPTAPGVPAPDAPAPGAGSPAPNAGTSSDNSSNSGGSSGSVRTAPRAAPNKPAGTVARQNPPAVAPSAPQPSWATTYTWTSTWTSPPTTTTAPPPPPPPTTTKPPPPPLTTTAVPTTPAVSTTTLDPRPGQPE